MKTNQRRIPSTTLVEVVSKEEYYERRGESEEESAGEESEEEEETFTVFFDPSDEEHGLLSPDTMLDIIYNDTKYSSATQAYEVERVTQLGRKDIRPLLLRQRNPKMIRQLGGRVAGKLEDPKKLWISILKTLVKQHEEIKPVLLSTGNDILVYADPKDIVLGVGLGKEDEGITDRSEWKGENLLGLAWKVVREDLKEEEKAMVGGGEVETYTEESKTKVEEEKEKRKGYFIGLNHRRKVF
jgi:ribA/ribD-fused uncharacterized protein